MDKECIDKLDDMIDQHISAEDFENKDLSRLIMTITQKMVGGDITIQFGETVTYADVLFSILCLADSLAKDNKNIGTIDKVLEDLVSMSKHEEFHKDDK